MKISVIIPNYNSLNLLKKNLPLVLKYFSGQEIIVVDDASSDKSCMYIRQKFPKIRLIENIKNLGFSSTVNIGVKAAKNNLVFLLNTDMIPTHNFLSKLTPYFDDSMVFAVGCLQNCPENGRTIARGRGIGGYTKGFLYHQKGKLLKNNTLWVSGGAGLFRKSIWDKIGGLSELYNPFYWEDVDISYRAQKAGYKVFFEPSCIVIHNQIQGSIRSEYTPEKIKQISYRNQIIFVWHNITDFDYLLQHLLYLTYEFILSLFKANRSYIFGLFEALGMLSGVLKKRSFNKSIFILKDSQILVNYDHEFIK